MIAPSMVPGNTDEFWDCVLRNHNLHWVEIMTYKIIMFGIFVEALMSNIWNICGIFLPSNYPKQK